jgi:membrane protease YdiL (CAAX protease family)
MRTGYRGLGVMTVATLAFSYLALTALSFAAGSRATQQAVLGPAIVTAFGVTAFGTAAALLPRVALPPVGVVGIALAMLAAVAEEAFFRRFLMDRLLRYGPAIAIGASALAFAAIHVPFYGAAALWVDLGAGLLLSWQRWASGSWTAPAATHVVANLLGVIR